MPTVHTVRCPVFGCGWFWQFTESTDDAWEHAKDEEAKHWREFHQPADPTKRGA